MCFAHSAKCILVLRASMGEPAARGLENKQAPRNRDVAFPDWAVLSSPEGPHLGSMPVPGEPPGLGMPILLTVLQGPPAVARGTGSPSAPRVPSHTAGRSPLGRPSSSHLGESLPGGSVVSHIHAPGTFPFLCFNPPGLSDGLVVMSIAPSQLPRL